MPSRFGCKGVSKAALKRARREEVRDIVESEGEAKRRVLMKSGAGGERGRERGGVIRDVWEERCERIVLMAGCGGGDVWVRVVRERSAVWEVSESRVSICCGVGGWWARRR